MEPIPRRSHPAHGRKDETSPAHSLAEDPSALTLAVESTLHPTAAHLLWPSQPQVPPMLLLAQFTRGSGVASIEREQTLGIGHVHVQVIAVSFGVYALASLSLSPVQRQSLLEGHEMLHGERRSSAGSEQVAIASSWGSCSEGSSELLQLARFKLPSCQDSSSAPVQACICALGAQTPDQIDGSFHFHSSVRWVSSAHFANKNTSPREAVCRPYPRPHTSQQLGQANSNQCSFPGTQWCVHTCTYTHTPAAQIVSGCFLYIPMPHQSPQEH